MKLLSAVASRIIPPLCVFRTCDQFLRGGGQAYDEGLAQRIREVVGELPGLVEKKMFGGVGFMVGGNMACGVNKNDLIVRVGRRPAPMAALDHRARLQVTLELCK